MSNYEVLVMLRYKCRNCGITEQEDIQENDLFESLSVANIYLKQNINHTKLHACDFNHIGIMDCIGMYRDKINNKDK